jgi:acyl carrier protein
MNDTQAGHASERNNSADFYYEQLTIYIRENVSAEFDPANDRLLDVLDSVGLLQLIMHIEHEFQIFMDPGSLSIEVFMDLGTLSAALKEYSAAA